MPEFVHVDDKWHGSGYLNRSAQPVYALALELAIRVIDCGRHFPFCARGRFT